jgi:hypothetical protein
VLTASDRRHGLALQLVVAGCITKAPGGGQTAGPSPVDRRKQGLKRAPSRPLASLAAPANRRDDAGVVELGPVRPPAASRASCAAAGRAALGKRAVRPSAARAGAAILGLDRSTGVRRGRSRS